jgi:hypothetical protein|eukprot:COSAG01_NODE_4268_length_5196_cov_4.984304_1_plen_109_part_00
MVWCKAALILWGALSMGTQLVLTGHCGAQLRLSALNDRQPEDGAVAVHTVDSRLRALFARTQTTRTQTWVQEGGGAHDSNNSSERTSVVSSAGSTDSILQFHGIGGSE